MKKVFSLFYGLACYLIFLATIFYTIGFVGNMVVPKSIDSDPENPLHYAIFIDASLLLLFALQHSIMARPAFKRWWTKFVPVHLERSTYVLTSSICFLMMMWQWQPVGGVVWSFGNDVVKRLVLIVYFCGWYIVFFSTLLVNHSEVFGLRHVWLYVKGEPYTPLPFTRPLFYQFVRHPLYTGYLIAFWSAPVMTVAHLTFAILTTGYIFTAIYLKEKDLQEHFGEKYVAYKDRVPMIIPFMRKK
jgi:methanethiol S-methyltransferase